MYVAQLTEPLMKITTSDGTCFNVDRLHARYFVLTRELGSYAHAMLFWAAGHGGVARLLVDASAAVERADGSGGEHFSFEKTDRVTRTTIRGRFIGCISEEAHHRGALVSFALSEEAVREAFSATCGGASNAIESDEEEAPQRQQTEREAAAMSSITAAAEAEAASLRRHDELNQKREAGKAREAQRQATTQAKRAAQN